MKRYQTQRVMLYYQIKELLKDNFNKSQISRKLSISRTTLYFYASMSEEEFCKWVKEVKKKAGKLSSFIVKQALPMGYGNLLASSLPSLGYSPTTANFAVPLNSLAAMPVSSQSCYL